MLDLPPSYRRLGLGVTKSGDQLSPTATALLVSCITGPYTPTAEGLDQARVNGSLWSGSDLGTEQVSAPNPDIVLSGNTRHIALADVLRPLTTWTPGPASDALHAKLSSLQNVHSDASMLLPSRGWYLPITGPLWTAHGWSAISLQPRQYRIHLVLWLTHGDEPAYASFYLDQPDAHSAPGVLLAYVWWWSMVVDLCSRDSALTVPDRSSVIASPRAREAAIHDVRRITRPVTDHQGPRLPAQHPPAH